MTVNNSEYTRIKPEQPRIEYSLDYVGPIRPMTHNKNVYFLPAVEGYTGQIMSWPSKT